MTTIKTVLEFEELIKQNKVIVEFFAEWNTPSKMLDMIIEELEEESDQNVFVKVDTDRFRTIARDYKVVTIPVIKIFENGKEVREKQGLMTKDELLNFINE